MKFLHVVCLGFTLVSACQQMSQSYSPRAFSQPASAAACLRPDIYKIGLCEVTLLQQTFHRANALHTGAAGYERGSKCVALCFTLQILSSSSLLLSVETIELEDLVAVWLHQLDFNERARGVQVPAGQRTDIEVLVRPGS